MMLASGVMALTAGAIYIGLERCPHFAGMLRSHKVIATAIEILAAGGIGAIIYAAAAWVLKIEELQYALSMFRGKFKRQGRN